MTVLWGPPVYRPWLGCYELYGFGNSTQALPVDAEKFIETRVSTDTAVCPHCGQ